MPKKISPISERFKCSDCGELYDQGVRRVYGIGWDDNCFDCFNGWLQRQRLVNGGEYVFHDERDSIQSIIGETLPLS